MGTSTSIIRYADYLETAHKLLMNNIFTNIILRTSNNPFSNDDFGDSLDPAFFTSGYTIASFPSMFDMYGKFLAGLDIETLFDQMAEHDVELNAIDNRVSSYSAELDDDIEESSWPRLAAGMRDINCVTSSNFVIAQSLLETKKLTLLTKYDTDLRIKMLAIAADRWKGHLEWNKGVVGQYSELFKLYYSLLMDLDNQDQMRKAKYSLWPFTLWEYYRLAVGVLTGATKASSSTEGSEPSTQQKVIGGAMAGAAVGTMIAPGWGTVIGGVIGGAAGYFS